MKLDILEATIGLLANGDEPTAFAIGQSVGCAPNLVQYHFGTMQNLIGEAIGEGCKRRIARIVVRGLACRHPSALALPKAAKSKAAQEV